MEQIERIKAMERCLDRVSQVVMRLSAALDEYVNAQDALHQLSDYYGSDPWKQDFAADSAGLLPPDLKRGVLSEDAVWNLLEDVRDLKERMRTIASDEENEVVFFLLSFSDLSHHRTCGSAYGGSSFTILNVVIRRNNVSK